MNILSNMTSPIPNPQSIDVLLYSEQPSEDNNDYRENVSFRTLHFIHIGPFIYNEIREYFQQFGGIKSMQINSKRDVHYGFAQLEMTDCEKADLSTASHFIANHMVHVVEVNIPGGRISFLSPLNILNALDDDSLRNVLDRLNLLELSKAAEVSVRFNKLTKDIFRSKYINFIDDTVDLNLLKQSDIEIVLRNFGSLIESLHITGTNHSKGYYGESDNICLIAKNCRNVKKLTMTNVKLNQTFKHLQPIFAQLDHFMMKHNSRTVRIDIDEIMEHLLSVCEKLKTLHIECRYFNMEQLKYIARKFPLLQEAHIIGFYNLEDVTLKNFITKNLTLKKLTINSIFGQKRLTDVFCLISQHLVNLTELEFDEIIISASLNGLHQDDMKYLSNLSSLKVLKLNFGKLPVLPLIENLVKKNISIEHLGLHHCCIDNEAIKSISKLKQIKILEISRTDKMTDDYLIELIKGLPQLSELYLEYTNFKFDISTIGIMKAISHANRLSLLKLNPLLGEVKIDMDDYDAMLKSVQSRSLKTKLVIDIVRDMVKINISEEILHKNHDWFNIKLSKTLYGDSADIECDEYGERYEEYDGDEDKDDDDDEYDDRYQEYDGDEDKDDDEYDDRYDDDYDYNDSSNNYEFNVLDWGESD